MSFLVPWAFLGLAALAIPVVVHLFGRRQAPRVRFPSLRLLPATRPTAATTTRPSDVVLLAVRCAVVIAAVLALAQPRWSTSGRERSARAPVRVVLVDTSASVQRLATGDGRPAIDVVRAIARGLLDSSRAGMVVETAHPGGEIGGAASWLDGRTGRREIVVISDFQLGAVTDGDLSSVPAAVGIRLERVPGIAPSAPDGAGPLHLGPAATGFAWRDSSGRAVSVSVRAAPSDQAAAGAAMAIADDGGSTPVGRALIVFPGGAMPDGGPADTTDIAPWVGDVALRLATDPVLSGMSGDSGCSRRGLPLAGAPGRPLARLIATPAAGEIVLQSCSGIGSFAGASLVARLAVALNPEDRTERDPVVVGDDQLRRWQHPPGAPTATGDDVESPDGRWFWLSALVLLGIEEWLRRRPAPVARPAGAAREPRAA